MTEQTGRVEWTQWVTPQTSVDPDLDPVVRRTSDLVEDARLRPIQAVNDGQGRSLSSSSVKPRHLDRGLSLLGPPRTVVKSLRLGGDTLCLTLGSGISQTF